MESGPPNMMVAEQMRHHMFDPDRLAQVVTLVAEASLARMDSKLKAVYMVHRTGLVPAQVRFQMVLAPWNCSFVYPSCLTARIPPAFLNMCC